MSDHDAAPDPIDEAYVQAEAMLSDDAARAERRARVLAAVARVPAASMAAAAAPAPAAAGRRAAWRPGGWLAAACVAGLSLFLAVRLYQPVRIQPQTAPVTGAPAATLAPTPSVGTPTLRAPPPKTRAVATLPEPAAAPQPSEASARQVPAPAPPVVTPAPPPAEIAPIAPPPPAAPIVAQAPRGFPAAAPPPPPEVASERLEQAPAAKAADSNGGSDEVVDVKGGLPAPASRRATFADAPIAGHRSESSAKLPPDQAARLRAAAAAGRTAEVEDLLKQGAPVDAPDAAGDTALIKSLQAGHPAVAAALRRHGASLDHKNQAGESARDIATTKGDPELNRAIGLGQ